MLERDQQQHAGGKMRPAKQLCGPRWMMSHRRFVEIFSMGQVNWSFDLNLMEQEIAQVCEAQRAQWEQQATNPGNAGTRMWEDPALVARIPQQVWATMAAENGTAREDEPSASTAWSWTAGDEVALGAKEKAKNAENSAR